MNKRLGDQWSVGNWAGMQAAIPAELPPHVLAALGRMRMGAPPNPSAPNEPPQNMKEYDPEWARAFWTGLASAGCDHLGMLSSVKVPILLTHHFRETDADTGGLMGAVSELQVRRARELVTAAGRPFEVVDLPAMAHAMHAHEPQQFTTTILDWVSGLSPSD